MPLPDSLQRDHGPPFTKPRLTEQSPDARARRHNNTGLMSSGSSRHTGCCWHRGGGTVQGRGGNPRRTGRTEHVTRTKTPWSPELCDNETEQAPSNCTCGGREATHTHQGSRSAEEPNEAPGLPEECGSLTLEGMSLHGVDEGPGYTAGCRATLKTRAGTGDVTAN